MMILIKATEEKPDFLVDARHLSLNSVYRRISKLSGIEITKPIKSYWKFFVWSGEDTSRSFEFKFRDHIYAVDDECPFTGDILVHSKDAPFADMLVIQNQIENYNKHQQQAAR